jgi:DNA-binding transcriptional LysR family regulator
MNKKPALEELHAFAAIVAHRSFRKAADELALSPSTLSHMMRTLEANMGVRLLNRTTRSVSPTDAGQRLNDRLGPVLKSLNFALAELDDYRDQTSGTLRINASEPAARLLMATVVPIFLREHPGMSLDLVTDGRLIDIVAEGFDAGVRLGEALPQDLVAVHFGGPVRFLAVASPAYVAEHGLPVTPDDLSAHSCIRIRMPSGKQYRWEFERHGQPLSVEVRGALTLDHIELMIDAAIAGLGIAYVPERSVRARLDDGKLLTLLEDWCPSIPGLFLYFPGNRLVPPGLRAFIDVLKAQFPLA